MSISSAIRLYRETFTQEEITSIIAFYSSPAGKAMVSNLMQARIGPMTQKLQGMIEQFQQDGEKAK